MFPSLIQGVEQGVVHFFVVRLIHHAVSFDRPNLPATGPANIAGGDFTFSSPIFDMIRVFSIFFSRWANLVAGLRAV